jgi:hypothetical protein
MKFLKEVPHLNKQITFFHTAGIFVVVFETRSPCVAQAGLELTM